MANEVKNEPGRMGKGRQQKLPAIRQSEVLANLVLIWTQQDGWLNDGTADELAERAEQLRVAKRELIAWGIEQGLFTEEDVIPF